MFFILAQNPLFFVDVFVCLVAYQSSGFSDILSNF
jgi:hypothetical protein